MSTAENPPRENPPRKTIQQLAEEQGVRPITSTDDMTADIFGSDEEFDAFHAQLHADRHGDDDLSRQRSQDWDDPEVWGPDERP